MKIKELMNNIEEAIRSEYDAKNFLDEKIDFSITSSNENLLDVLTYNLKYSNEETLIRFKLEIEFRNTIMDIVSDKGEGDACIRLYKESGCCGKYPYFGDDPISVKYCDKEDFKLLDGIKSAVLDNFDKEYVLKDILLSKFRYHKKPRPITHYCLRDNILEKIKDRDKSIHYAMDKKITSIRRKNKELVFRLANYAEYSDHYHSEAISEFGLSFSFDYEDPECDSSLLNVVSYKDYGKKVKFKIDKLPAKRYVIFTVEELIRLEEETFNKIMGEINYYLSI